MMINSEKLMGRMESKGTLLSEKSISNVGVIRRRLVDIDGMLKDKLVLAKVREGIRRQEEERLRRVEREDDIEERDDDDRDIDMDDGKRKRKKPKPGGPSNILGPAGAILTGAGIALIANNLGTFRVTAQVLKGVGSVAVSTFMGAATAINAGYKVVNAIETRTLQMFGDKGLQTLKQFQKVFSTFVNVAIVTAVTAGGVSVLGKTRRRLFPGRKPPITPPPIPPIKTNAVDIFDTRSKVTEGLEKIFRKARRRKPSRSFAEVKREIDLREFDSLTPEAKRRIRSENIRRTLSETREGLFDRKPRVQREDFLGMNKPRRRVRVPDSPINLLQRQRQRSTRRIVTPVGDQLIDDILGSESFKEKAAKLKQAQKNAAVEVFTELNKNVFSRDGTYYLRKGDKIYLLEEVTIGNRQRLVRATNSPPIDESTFNRASGRTVTKKFGESVQDQQTQQPQSNVKRKIKSDSNFFEDPGGGPGAMKLRRGIISNADNVTNVKSLSKLLEAFGGLPLIKATRQFLGNTVGRIPLFGDLIGILLDVFVFKQPVQKALFMAAGGALGGSIGAWLGGILGTAVPVVGNLAGAVVGGFLGGVGGDLLGGFLYDVLFAGKPGFPAATTQNPLEKGAKGTLKLGLSGGGLVPALLSMNNGGSVPDIGYSASYDKPGAGSVRFIPIPITSSSDTGSTTTSSGGVFVTKRKRSQSSLYAGGLIT